MVELLNKLHSVACHRAPNWIIRISVLDTQTKLIETAVKFRWVDHCNKSEAFNFEYSIRSVRKILSLNARFACKLLYKYWILFQQKHLIWAFLSPKCDFYKVFWSRSHSFNPRIWQHVKMKFIFHLLMHGWTIRHRDFHSVDPLLIQAIQPAINHRRFSMQFLC